MARLVKACLNGDRSRADHPAVPVTPEGLAREAEAAVEAGAGAIHLHPRGADEKESLRWADIRDAVEAVRTRCPGIPIGVSTREGIVPDLWERLALLAEWDRGPDFASVNFHEVGAEQIADLLIERGIEIEAGLFTPAAAEDYVAWGGPVTRVLVEAIPGISPGSDGIAAAQATLAVLPTTDVLAHGENEWAWPVLRWASEKGYDVRLGFEDMLTGPDGQQVRSNADLLSYL
ncbi:MULTISPECIES: 3-keto-5-aminohexanoate cleavage protein [unclassified Kribbella]|uniref:3-keto-5-aminohexanoate cleavage protein n=1 Tax=unclassified Kribbella TaxID=2644121 RepID=UPI003017364A